MQAVQIHEHGGPEVLRVVELPDPTPGPGEVLARVLAVSVNHLDLWVRRGMPGMPLNSFLIVRPVVTRWLKRQIKRPRDGFPSTFPFSPNWKDGKDIKSSMLTGRGCRCCGSASRA